MIISLHPLKHWDDLIGNLIQMVNLHFTNQFIGMPELFTKYSGSSVTFCGVEAELHGTILFQLFLIFARIEL
jgi:hypothetical protein